MAGERGWGRRGLSRSDLLLVLLLLTLVGGGFAYVFHEPGPVAKPVGQRDGIVSPRNQRRAGAVAAASAPGSPPLTTAPGGADAPAAGPVEGVVPGGGAAPRLQSRGRPRPAVSSPAQPRNRRHAPPGLPPLPAAATAVEGALRKSGEEGEYGLAGTVFALQTGLPLEGCQVSFAGARADTGAAGVFSLWTSRPVGRLRISRTGYRSETISRLDLGVGEPVLHFDVYLAAEKEPGKGRIELNGVNGRVFDRASGAPLVNARIRVGSRRTLSDEAGFFELWGNDTGLATLQAVAPGHITEMVSGIEFTNLGNPFFYEVSLEANADGRHRLALVGIGARLVQGKEGVEIAALLDNSPAAREGLKPGDRLVAVDGLAVDDFSLGEVVELIRGEAGRPVTLMVERDGEFLKFTCTRERVVY